MKRYSILFVALTFLSTSLASTLAAREPDVPGGATPAETENAQPVPGNVTLIEGYKHEPLQGIDSTVGKIVSEDGFEIFYEQGRIPDPNSPFRLGGDFSNGAERIPAEQRKWSRTQTINEAPIQIVMTKTDQLIVTCPKSGINFSAKIKTETDLADTLLMLLTFGTPQAQKPL